MRLRSISREYRRNLSFFWGGWLLIIVFILIRRIHYGIKQTGNIWIKIWFNLLTHRLGWKSEFGCASAHHVSHNQSMLAVPPRNLPGVEWFERVHVQSVRHAIPLQWCSPRGTQQIAAKPSDWDEQQKQMCAVFWQHWIPTKISLERWIENKNNLANCRRDSPKEHIAIG